MSDLPVPPLTDRLHGAFATATRLCPFSVTADFTKCIIEAIRETWRDFLSVYFILIRVSVRRRRSRLPHSHPTTFSCSSHPVEGTGLAVIPWLLDAALRAVHSSTHKNTHGSVHQHKTQTRERERARQIERERERGGERKFASRFIHHLGAINLRRHVPFVLSALLNGNQKNEKEEVCSRRRRFYPLHYAG